VATKNKTRQRRGATSEISQATLDTLLEATEIVLSRDGFAAMTTAGIAKESGFAKATVYYYFASKEALVQLVVERTWKQFATKFLMVLQEVDGQGDTKEISALCDALVDFVVERPKLFGQWFEAVPHLARPERRSEMLSMVISAIRDRLIYRAAALRPMDAEVAAHVLVYSSIGALMIVAREQPAMLLTEAFRTEFRMLVLGHLGVRPIAT